MSAEHYPILVTVIIYYVFALILEISSGIDDMQEEKMWDTNKFLHRYAVISK